MVDDLGQAVHVGGLITALPFARDVHRAHR